MLLCSHLHSSVLCRLGLHRCRSYVPNLPLSSYYATTPHTSFNTLRGTTPTLVPRKKVYTVEETLHYLHAQLLSANPPAPFSMYVAMRGEVVADRVAFLISSAMMNFNQWCEGGETGVLLGFILFIVGLLNYCSVQNQTFKRMRFFHLPRRMDMATKQPYTIQRCLFIFSRRTSDSCLKREVSLSLTKREREKEREREKALITNH